MTQQASVSAEDLIRALKRRKAALPAEIGSFVVLEVCEALLHARPAIVSVADVLIAEDGSVRLSSAPSTSELEAAHGLHRLLASMLVAAGPAPLPALMRLLEKGPSSGRWTLASIRDDLEASLVPLNRTASRRVLSRFVREIGWAERVPAQKPTFQDLDSELSSFLGAGRTRATLQIEPDSDEITQEDPVEALRELDEAQDQVEFFESVRPTAPRTSAVLRESTGKTLVDTTRPAPPQQLARDTFDELRPKRQSSPASAPLRAHETDRREHAPSLRPLPRASAAPSAFPRPRRSGALLWGALLLALSLGIVIATLQLRPELFSRLSKQQAATQPLKPKAPLVRRPAAGDLVVRVGTERAQILRFVGRGPVTVPHLPLGISHEFVAVADAASPARLLVPKDAEWENTPDGQRYEAAMQLGKGAGAGFLELGDSLLPQDVGTPSAKLGSVRIVTTPRAAKVYQIIGFAPEALVEALPLDATQELLIYRKGYSPEIRVVAPSDYQEEGGKKRAHVDVTLVPAPKR